jgi:hypothetical protein
VSPDGVSGPNGELGAVKPEGVVAATPEES